MAAMTNNTVSCVGSEYISAEQKGFAMMQMYVFYMTCYVILRFTVSVAEFVTKFGETRIGFIDFIIDWICLFAIYQFQPLVDDYREYLEL